MRRNSHCGTELENDAIDYAVSLVWGGDQHHKENHKLGVEDQQPGEYDTDGATYVFDEPQTATIWPADA